MNGNVSSSPSQAAAVAAPLTRTGVLTRVMTPGVYALFLAVVALLAAGYSQRKDGIFACEASGYGNDRYVGYCQSKSYGDYDHGAFWFGLEPKAIAAATNAEALIIGNSRTQMGFSSQATDDWFSSAAAPYYLLGFSHNGNYRFEEPLLRRLQVRPKVYVMNLDLFFESFETGPARTVMHDPGAKVRYEQKRMWRSLHRPLCGAAPLLCGDEPAFMRSVSTGAWTQVGGHFESKPVSFDPRPDPKMVEAYSSAAREFLAQLQVPSECVLLTVVPTVQTPSGTANAIASSLGMDLVAPEPDGLMTYDGSHLEPASAEIWSKAFFAAAGPRIRACLGRPDSARASPAAYTGGSR